MGRYWAACMPACCCAWLGCGWAVSCCWPAGLGQENGLVTETKQTEGERIGARLLPRAYARVCVYGDDGRRLLGGPGRRERWRWAGGGLPRPGKVEPAAGTLRTRRARDRHARPCRRHGRPPTAAGGSAGRLRTEARLWGGAAPGKEGHGRRGPRARGGPSFTELAMVAARRPTSSAAPRMNRGEKETATEYRDQWKG